MKDKLLKCIKDELANCSVYLNDINNDGQKFEAIVISKAFENLSLVKQHQIIMKALKTKFDSDIHALTLKTFTPEKWAKEKINYNIEGA